MRSPAPWRGSSRVVRTNTAALRLSEPVDLAEVAATADVNAVLTGTQLRAGERLRISVQLAEAPNGTVLWSHTLEAPLVDL